jgi:hypothetical protein
MTMFPKSPVPKAKKSVVASTTRWDEAMTLINDLVAEEKDDAKLQKLQKIKSILVSRVDEKQDKLVHLPLQLTRKVAKSSSAFLLKGVDVSVGAVKGTAGAVTKGVGASVGVVKSGLNLTGGALHKGFTATGMNKPVGQMTDTVRYILKEFGGIHDPVPEADAKLLNAESSMELSTQHAFDRKAVNYVLPEFKALSKEAQSAVFRLLSWSNLKRWEFNIFDLMKITKGNPLLFVGWAILGSPHSQFAMARTIGSTVELHELTGYNFVESFLRIPPKMLCNYLRVIQKDYKDENPYHNATHAADVVQTTHALIQLVGSNLQTSKLELFSILLAAVVHDVNHPGQTNTYQENARTDLALLYNGQSILENRHASHAFRVMLADESASKSFALSSRRLSHVNIKANHNNNGGASSASSSSSSDLNLLCNVSPAQLKAIRSKVIDAILHTDMSRHFAMVNAMKALVMTNTNSTTGLVNVNANEDNSWKILSYILHMADISGQAKADPLFLVWTERCLEEFFEQGDMEMALGLPVSPNCDRDTTQAPEAQFGFVQYVILPAYEVLGTIISPQVEERILPIVRSNLEYWRSHREKDASSANNNGGGAATSMTGSSGGGGDGSNSNSEEC